MLPTPGNRFELLRPRQIEQIRATSPVAMFPLGTLEFHGRHLPVGLDAVKAHELLLRLSQRVGGVVMPPLFVGTGGGHGAYEWTILGSPQHLQPLIVESFCRMYQFGFTVQVAITGHYPHEQTDMLKAAAAEARQRCPGLQLWAGAEFEAVDGPGPRPADHAAKWETSILQAMRPDLVSMVELNLDGSGRPVPWPEYDGEEAGYHRMSDDRQDPLYGIMGMDPRVFADAYVGGEVVETILTTLHAWTRGALETVRAAHKGG